jgi:hypothetical protein
MRIFCYTVRILRKLREFANVLRESARISTKRYECENVVAPWLASYILDGPVQCAAWCGTLSPWRQRWPHQYPLWWPPFPHHWFRFRVHSFRESTGRPVFIRYFCSPALALYDLFGVGLEIMILLVFGNPIASVGTEKSTKYHSLYCLMAHWSCSLT